MRAAQREDGLFFPDDPTANAWMAYFLVETFGMTADKSFERPARLASEAILGLPASDDASIFWQLIVLRAAEAAGLLPGSSPLPGASGAGSALEVARTEQRLRSARGHDRRTHQAWRWRAVKPWRAFQRKDGCGAGSWEGSVEATSYLVPLFGRECWSCRAFGRVGADE